MSLDGLRAWIGEVERKLGIRTRVFLVLAVIAIGGAGAAVYLAVDARESTVSESDVQALQERLEAQIGEGGGGAATGATQLETELRALRAQVEELEEEGGGGASGKSGAATGKSGAGAGGAGGRSKGSGGGASEGTSGSSGGGSSGSAAGTSPGSKLQELVEQAEGKAGQGK